MTAEKVAMCVSLLFEGGKKPGEWRGLVGLLKQSKLTNKVGDDAVACSGRGDFHKSVGLRAISGARNAASRGP